MQNKKIEALILLLDDPAEEIYKEVTKQLLQIGEEAIKPLEIAWEDTLSELQQNRIENILHTIQFNELKFEFQEWIKQEKRDLLHVLFLISRTVYINLGYEELKKENEAIIKSLWLPLKNNLTMLEKVRILNKALFQSKGFKTSPPNLQSYQQFLVSNLFKNKIGSELLIAIVYIHYASLMNLDVRLLKPPFISFLGVYSERQNNPLLLIDLISGGNIINPDDILDRIQNRKIIKDKINFSSFSFIELIKTLILGLQKVYELNNKTNKISDLEEIINIIKHGGTKE